MTSAGEVTIRSSKSQPQSCSEKPHGQHIPPISDLGHIHKLGFFPALLTKYIQATTSTSPLAFANGISFLSATQSKYQVSGKCLCRLKLTCKTSSASLALKPHAVKLSLSLSTLEGIKQFFQNFLNITSATETPNSCCSFSSSLQRLWPDKRPVRELSSNRCVLQFEMWEQYSVTSRPALPLLGRYTTARCYTKAEADVLLTGPQEKTEDPSKTSWEKVGKMIIYLSLFSCLWVWPGWAA